MVRMCVEAEGSGGVTSGNQKIYVWEGESPSNACFCIGPQNGEPLCPCRMRGVIVRDGRYILPERDLGPVVKSGEKL